MSDHDCITGFCVCGDHIMCPGWITNRFTRVRKCECACHTSARMRKDVAIALARGIRASRDAGDYDVPGVRRVVETGTEQLNAKLEHHRISAIASTGVDELLAAQMDVEIARLKCVAARAPFMLKEEDCR